MRIASLLRTSTVRFTALYTVVFCVSVTLLLGLIYEATVRAIDREIDGGLETELAGLKEVHQRLGLSGVIEVVRERSASLEDADNAYLLVDSAGRPLAGNLAQWPAAANKRATVVQFELEVAGGAHLYRGRILVLGKKARLLAAHDIHSRARIQVLITEALGSALAIALALGVTGGIVTTRSMMRRMAAIAEASERIVAGRLSERIPVAAAEDEFGRLAAQLNHMLDRIEELVTGMRTMSDNIAHDLRAPLTRLRAVIELALSGPPDPAHYCEALQKALFEVDRVLGVFNAVMSIAQARSGALRGQMEVLDLATLAAETSELYEPLGEVRGLTLEVVAPLAVAVLGHRQLLAQALANLLDNAVKFTPPGGSVQVAVCRRGDQAIAMVADSGPGIAPDELEHVLEPFVRGTACEAVPGSGLGLSLVAAVVRLHGATIALEDNAPGLRVTLALPVASPERRAPGGTAATPSADGAQ